MTADRLLAPYDRVAEAPDAVSRLRRFVLDLGVRGKLVEQDPADEPASELLKRIAAEKVRRVNVGRTGRKKAVHPEMAPPPFNLPRTWRWASLGAVFQYDAGTQCDPKALDSSGWLLELQDIEKGTGRLLDRVRTSERKSKSTKSQFLPGDILYGKLRPYLNKVLVADETGYSTTEIVAIRPYLQLSSEYCALALRRPDFVDYVTRLGQGTKMPRLRTKDAVVAPFPLPPLAEQRRIVAKVDELMALCDRLEEARTVREDTRDRLTKASLARLSAADTDVPTFRSHARFAVNALPALTARVEQIKHLRQSILNLAVRGKLVGHDPEDEPALELLKRIAIAKSELKQKTGDSRIRPAHNPNRKDYPVSLPGSWEVQSFENLFLFVDYRGKTPPKTDAGVPLITAKNVRFGSLNREPREFIGQESFKAWMTRGFPQIGDLLFTTEAPMANICLNNIREPFALAQRVICLQPYGDICTRYFMFATMSNLTQTLIKDHSTGLTAKGIKAAKLKPIPIPIPPLVEQHRIVAKVDELMALCDRIEAGLAASDVTRSRLLESLIHDAFRTLSAS